MSIHYMIVVFDITKDADVVSSIDVMGVHVPQAYVQVNWHGQRYAAQVSFIFAFSGITIIIDSTDR